MAFGLQPGSDWWSTLPSILCRWTSCLFHVFHSFSSTGGPSLCLSFHLKRWLLPGARPCFPTPSTYAPRRATDLPSLLPRTCLHASNRGGSRSLQRPLGPSIPSVHVRSRGLGAGGSTHGEARGTSCSFAVRRFVENGPSNDEERRTTDLASQRGRTKERRTREMEVVL